MSRLAPVAENSTLWRADSLAQPAGRVLSTGHATLDPQLPGGGWPVGALVEILQAHSAQNEWRLLLPALARSGSGPVVLVGAPHMPFGPGLSAQGLAPERLLWIRAEEPAARMWACEQALRCTQVEAVLGWLPQARADQLRRLQMAAAAHGKLLFVMRPARAQNESSPAVLRLLAGLQPQGDGVQVDILKRKGPPIAQALQLPARAARLAALLGCGGAGLHRSARVSVSAPGRSGQGDPAGAAASPLIPKAGDALDRVAAAA
ncbi:MAG: translesion DNA synthesis-associated protein ImuA [Rhodoferax sp.]|nr:translesion DNA synthesis-associated protein ImuA [Rhodoferax sp.]MBP9930451.1 translesion DNA synthesis-associated protein ImuA [Rhodoferax sp.]